MCATSPCDLPITQTQGPTQWASLTSGTERDHTSAAQRRGPEVTPSNSKVNNRPPKQAPTACTPVPPGALTPASCADNNSSQTVRLCRGRKKTLAALDLPKTPHPANSACTLSCLECGPVTRSPGATGCNSAPQHWTPRHLAFGPHGPGGPYPDPWLPDQQTGVRRRGLPCPTSQQETHNLQDSQPQPCPDGTGSGPCWSCAPRTP